MPYNFGRIHQALRATPAMVAGVLDHVRELEEIATLTNKLQERPADTVA